MPFGISDNLPALVAQKFQSALAAEELIFSSTQLAIIRTSSGLPFQLRYCPALAKKPTSSPAKPTAPKKVDPFENPNALLHVANIPVDNTSHILVLNKYPVIQDHFILATKDYKSQTHQLEKDDLAVALQCIHEWEKNGSRRLYAFFNSGPHSGASQPHRHLQFLPVECMSNQDGSSGWSLITDRIIASSGEDLLPFTYFRAGFTQSNDPDNLHQVYLRLYEAAVQSVRAYVSTLADDLELRSTAQGDLPISFNLAMTSNGMVICPRRTEGIPVREDKNGFVALNGTVLSGSLMVKDEVEYELLQKRPQVLDTLLSSIGIPNHALKDADANKLLDLEMLHVTTMGEVRPEVDFWYGLDRACMADYGEGGLEHRIFELYQTEAIAHGHVLQYLKIRDVEKEGPFQPF